MSIEKEDRHPSKVVVLTEADVRSLLDMGEAIKAMESIFRAFAENKTQMIPRQYVFAEEYEGRIGFMPAYVSPLGIAGVKIVTAHKQNLARYGLPTVQATTVLSDARTGLPLAFIGASYSTMIRTGAVAGLAAKYLARSDAAVAGILGAGNQGVGQLLGLAEVRRIKKVFVYDVSLDNSREYAQKMGLRLGVEVIPCERIEDVVRSVDILAMATPSATPIINDRWVQAGTHISSIGVSTAGKQEICTEILTQAKLVVDEYEQTSQIGGISVAVAGGAITRDHIYSELGELVTGKKKGRTSPSEVTVFVSSGLSIQDIAVAHLVYEKAKTRSIGTWLDWVV